MNEEVETTEKLDKQGVNKPERNEKGQLLPGNTANLKGRPKGQSLKEYDREKFAKMTDKEKERFLKGLSSEMRYRMAEGNPATQTDITSKGEKLEGFNFNTPYDSNDKSKSETGQGMEDTER